MLSIIAKQKQYVLCMKKKLTDCPICWTAVWGCCVKQVSRIICIVGTTLLFEITPRVAIKYCSNYCRYVFAVLKYYFLWVDKHISLICCIEHTMGDIDVDSAISALMSASDHPPGTEVNLPEDQICKIVRACRQVFMQQPMLIEIRAPVNICGDTHGQFSDLLRMFEVGGVPPAANYLFLGDYVDRAKQSIEVITLMMCFKLKYPENFFLLRGNHECASLNRIYGFYDECKRRYSVKLWRIFADAFNCMPVVAVVEDKIICMHGGLSPDLEQMSQIFDIPRPTDVPDEGLLCDLLWADPDPNVLGWGYNARCGYLFSDTLVLAWYLGLFLPSGVFLILLGTMWSLISLNDMGLTLFAELIRS